MATTTNFGWETPDDTDLVKDGALAMRTLGNSIDTSLVDLKGGTTGQILSKASNTDMDFTWIANDQGDITGVTAGTGISGGGSSGAVTITNDMATTITASGDIIVGTGSGTYDNLPIGTTGQVLTADTTVSPYKVKWATASGGGAYTLLNAGGTTLSGTTVNISSISGSYTDLYLVLADWQLSGTTGLTFRFNNNSSNLYYQTGTVTDGNGSGSLKGNADASGMDIGFDASSGNQINTSVMQVFSYADATTAKVGNMLHFAKWSTDQQITSVGYGWWDASAITEINIIVGGGQSFNGGKYYLYGVK